MSGFEPLFEGLHVRRDDALDQPEGPMVSAHHVTDVPKVAERPADLMDANTEAVPGVFQIALGPKLSDDVELRELTPFVFHK